MKHMDFIRTYKHKVKVSEEPLAHMKQAVYETYGLYKNLQAEGESR